MKRLILPSQTLAAARLCQGYKDVRYFLNGVHVTHNTIVSTNGHIMFVGPYRNEDGKQQWLPPSQEENPADELQIGQSLILDIRGVIPVKAQTSELMFTEAYPFAEIQRRKRLEEEAREANVPLAAPEPINTERTGVILHRDGHGRTIGSSFFSTIDGIFPRWEKIIDDADAAKKSTEGSAYAALEYFGLANKVIGKIARQWGRHGAAEVEIFHEMLRFKHETPDGTKYQMIVMGMRK